MFVNFVGLELRCDICKLMFSSKSLMYKHIKSSCTDQNQANAALIPSSVLPLVIKSVANNKAMDSGYMFRG